jgi:hypothetical protein
LLSFRPRQAQWSALLGRAAILTGRLPMTK